MQPNEMMDPELNKAKDLYKGMRYEEALSLFITIENNPFSNAKRVAEAQFFIGRVYLKLKNISKAIEYFNKASAENAEIGAAAMYALGEVYFAQAKYNEAKIYYKEAVKRGRKDAEQQLINVEGILRQIEVSQVEMNRGSIYISNAETEIERLKRRLLELEQSNALLKQNESQIKQENDALKIQLDIQKDRHNQSNNPTLPTINIDEDEIMSSYRKLSVEKDNLEKERELLENDKEQFKKQKIEFERNYTNEIQILLSQRSKVENEYYQIESKKNELDKRLEEIEKNLKTNELINEHQITNLIQVINNLRAQILSLPPGANMERIQHEISLREQELAQLKSEIEQIKQTVVKEQNQILKEKADLEIRKNDLLAKGAALFDQERKLIEREKRLNAREEELERQKKAVIENKSREVESLKLLAKQINRGMEGLAKQEEEQKLRMKKLKEREEELKREEKLILEKNDLLEKSLKMLKATPLREAIESKIPERVTGVLNNCLHTINEPDSHGRTALHWAAATGHIDIIKILIIAGAKCNIISSVIDDDKYPFECLPKKALFSIEDKYQKTREKMKYLAIQHQKLQPFEEFKLLVNKSIPEITQEKIQKVISNCIEDDIKLLNKFKGCQILHPELNKIYTKYHESFRLILDPSCAVDDAFLTGISVGDLIKDYKILKKCAKDQRSEYINSGEVAKELYLRVEIILIFKSFGRLDVIKQILAIAKIISLEISKEYLNDILKLQQNFEKFLFEKISKGSNPNKEMRLNCIKLLEQNQYKIYGTLDEILNSISKCEAVLNYVRGDIHRTVGQLDTNHKLTLQYLPLLRAQAKIDPGLNSTIKILSSIQSSEKYPDEQKAQKKNDSERKIISPDSAEHKFKADNKEQSVNNNAVEPKQAGSPADNRSNHRAPTVFVPMPSVIEFKNTNHNNRTVQNINIKQQVINVFAAWEKSMQQNISKQSSPLIIDLIQQAKTYSFDCYDVPRDGACFFHAISHQLSRYGKNLSANQIRESIIF